MVTPAQVFFSYLLLVGLIVGIAALVMMTLARFWPRRRLFVFYFWLFTAAVVGGAIGCVTVRNVFHSALLLILSLVGVAGYFILVNAEFLAMVQVIIYIGGIMVLFLFGIMVSQNIIGTQLKQNTPHSPWAAAAAGVLFIVMFFVGLFMTLTPSVNAVRDPLGSNTASVGWSLMATYVLPFEVASVLLLMAMLGAIILVRKD